MWSFTGDSPGVPVPEDAADAGTTAKALTHSHTHTHTDTQSLKTQQNKASIFCLLALW